MRPRHVDFATDADLVAVAHRMTRQAIPRDLALAAPALTPLPSEIGRRFERGIELFRAP